MTSSSRTKKTGRALLIQSADELAEFRTLLEDLAVPVEVHDGGLPGPDDFQDVALAIVSGKRLVDGPAPSVGLWPRTVAVVDGASKTLIAHLNRLGVSLVIRRPIHPRTLRLLLLHELYRGPERRIRKRVSIGHPIRVRAGLFNHRATLLELSSSGARIEMPQLPKVGSKLRLLLDKQLTDGKPLKLRGEVVRCLRPPGAAGAARQAVVGVAVLDAKANAAAIQRILQRFAAGPASWSGAPKPATRVARPAQQTVEKAAEQDPKTTAATEPNDPPVVSSMVRTLPPVHAGPGPAPSAAAQAQEGERQEDPRLDATGSAPPSDDDRRGDRRIAYERRIVALGEEAARVLVGRDLCQGGMRIMQSEDIAVGDSLRVALHCGTATEPLVVHATALRDDGEEGIVLTFAELSAGQREHLEKIIAGAGPLPDLAGDDPILEDAESGHVVLGEMLEHIENGQRDESGDREAGTERA